MAIRLVTLGGLKAFVDDDEMDWLQAQRLRAALLVYLAIERTATRATVTSVFWPESEEDNARHALRQNLYQLKRVLGDDWVDARAHDLRIGDAIETDVTAFRAALDGDEAEAAARLYGGPFLDGVHIADLKAWESWVDGQRAQLARAFRGACRTWVEQCRARGDRARAIEAAQRWIAPDPLDDEGQHTLLVVLTEAGRRTDALRQYDVYRRLLEPDGLEPLDETRSLVASLRDGGPADLPDPDAADRLPVPAPPVPGTFPAGTLPLRIAPPVRKPSWRRSRGLRFGAAVAAVVLSVVGVRALMDAPVPAGAQVLFTGVDNRTGDPQLSPLSLQLRTSLEQSPRLQILDVRELDAILDAMVLTGDEKAHVRGETALDAAWRAGAPIVVNAWILHEDGAFLLFLEIVNIGERPDRIARRWEATFTASSKDRIPAAVDSAGAWVRYTLGEAVDDIAVRSVPVSRATTAEWEALLPYDSAVTALSENRLTAAFGLLNRAIAVDSAFALAWAKLGDYYGMVDLGEALVYWERALSLRDSTRLADNERLQIETMVDLDSGRTTEALDGYRIWARAYPFEYRARFGFAFSLMDAGKVDSAAVEFARMAEDFPNYPEIAFTVARHAEADMLLGDFASASDNLERLAEFASVASWRGVLGSYAGRLAMLQGELDAADAHFRTLLDSGDPYWESVAYSHLASLAAETGDAASARSWLLTGIEADRARMDESASPVTGPHLLGMKLLGLGWLDLVDGAPDDCARRAHEAARITRDPRRLAGAGTLLARCGHPDAALALLEKVPDSLEYPVFDIARDRIAGEAFAALGRLDSARIRLDGAAVLERPTAHLEYHARILALSGDTAAATAGYRRILDNPAWGFRDNEGLLLFPGLLADIGRRVARLTPAG